MPERCPGCGKSFRLLGSHLTHHLTCPAAIEHRGGKEQQEPQSPLVVNSIVEDEDGEIETLYQIPEPSSTVGVTAAPAPVPSLTVAEVKSMLAEGIAAAVAQVGETVNARLQAERQATTEQLSQVGPAVLTYLREEATKERAEAEKAAAASPPPAQAPGAPNGLGELIALFQTFAKPSAGGLDQVAETIGSIGKLADAMDSLRYRPWRDGVDFATQNILQQSRMGIEPDKAAKALQDNPPNWAARPTPSAPEQK